MLYVVKILPFTPDSNSKSMHAIRDRIGIPVNIPGRCLYRYIYISSMSYKTVLQTLETMKLGKNGGG